ncbi:MAG: tripartite tricarboxylate transporter permease, partial [Planctomycetes bacterium]|nr:tripartite tricarboxylate transporter permease [Planctomycetota bacterium]
MEALTSGFGLISQPDTLFYIACGTIMGVLMGAMPGVNTSMAIVLAMTFTYAMNPIQAICFLVSVYVASNTGGGITAILFNIPGTPQAAPTTFDGYPMALRGEGGKALGYAIIGSAVGSVLAAFA